MRIDKIFHSKYLRPGDLDGQMLVTIENFFVEEIKGETKGVLSFEETTKVWTLNQINSRTITKVCGPETDDWIGARMTLFLEKIEVQGEPKLAIRVQDVEPAEKGLDFDDDDIPF